MTEQELEKLYTESYKAVYWTAISILKNKEDAEDVVQDTFITAYNSYESLKDKTKAVAWIKKIAANKCLNIVTRKRTFNADDEFLENTEAVAEDFLPESIVESSEKRKIIMDIIDDTLSEDTKMTIILFYFNEMSIKEIAERLNIPQGTVLSRLNYAKKKIKAGVEKYEKDSNDKLFAAVPFLTLLFEKEAQGLPLAPIPAAIKGLAASSKVAAGSASKAAAAKATATTAKAAGTAAKAVSKAVVIRNIALGLAATVAIGGAGVFTYKTLSTKNDIPKETEERESIVETEDTADTTPGTSAPETSGTVSEERPINVLGMTPDLLNIPGGYVRYCEQHEYRDDTDTEAAGHEMYYDADGNLVLECAIYDGTVTYSDYFIYDDEGRVIREELWDVRDNRQGLYTDYTYGRFGIEQTETGYFNRDPERYFVYEYDDQGRLTRITRYSYANPDAVYWYCDYIYDEDGTYTTVVTSFDTLSQRMEQSNDYSRYDADGRLIEEYESWYGQYTYYTYDNRGLLTLAESYRSDNLHHRVVYEYDNNGRLTREYTEDRNGNLTAESLYVYRDL
ncbi:MAG: sigma-70 family RNA polymerase sigma factor [Clostridiales bacterium]|nr:sigma-70 family RNA polymerase sigma factor [Clostridiales bacterium]